MLHDVCCKDKEGEGNMKTMWPMYSSWRQISSSELDLSLLH